MLEAALNGSFGYRVGPAQISGAASFLRNSLSNNMSLLAVDCFAFESGVIASTILQQNIQS